MSLSFFSLQFCPILYHRRDLRYCLHIDPAPPSGNVELKTGSLNLSSVWIAPAENDPSGYPHQPTDCSMMVLGLSTATCVVPPPTATQARSGYDENVYVMVTAFSLIHLGRFPQQIFSQKYI